MGFMPLCASQGFHHFSGCECELIKNVCFSAFLIAEIAQEKEHLFKKSGIGGLSLSFSTKI